MVTLQAVRDEFQQVSRLYRLAKNPLERASIARFILKSAVAYHISDKFFREDTTVYLHGTKYIIGLQSGEIGIFEEFYGEKVYDREADFISKIGWTVFDLGANVGLFTIQQARRGAHVFAFEPNPDCYRRLSKAIVANELTSQVSILNYAVGSAPGSGTMLVPDSKWTTMGCVIPVDSSNSGHTPPVKITSLDRIVPSLDVARIDLLKIDVEGAEVGVLRGAARTLELVERIVLECHSRDLLDQVGMFLDGHGFSQVLQIGNTSSPDVQLLYARRSLSTR